MTSEQHYRIAERLLADEDFWSRRCFDEEDAARDQRTRELAQVHATLAAAGVTRQDVDRFEREDEAHLASLPRHTLDSLGIQRRGPR
jgi:hypothetical protein